MTLTSTSNLEVLFQDLRDQDIASISGGGTTTITASATASGDGTVVNARTEIVTSSPTPTSPLGKISLLDSLNNVLYQGNINDANGIVLNLLFR